MKRLISLALAIALLLTMGTQVATADEDRKSGAFTYRIKGNGTATITGYDWPSVEGQDIYIPRMLDGYTVTEIGASVFSTADETGYSDKRHKISSLIIPDTITVIGERAFMGCEFESIRINIPASVQHIGGGAFSDLRGIEQFTVDGNNQTYAVIDGNLYNKPQKELVACGQKSGFADNTIPEGILSIGDYACAGLDAISVHLPSTLINIGKYAFRSSNLSIGNFPSSLSTMGEGAFYFYRSGFAALDLSKTQLTEIPPFAFFSCSIGEVFCPSSLCEIGENAFADVPFGDWNNLFRGFKFKLDNTQVNKIGNKAFSGSTLSEIILPSTIQTIGSEAFLDCYNLKTLTLPASIKQIGDNMCDRTTVVLDVEPGSYAAVWASENGYMTQGDDSEDTSWLND